MYRFVQWFWQIASFSRVGCVTTSSRAGQARRTTLAKVRRQSVEEPQTDTKHIVADYDKVLAATRHGESRWRVEQALGMRQHFGANVKLKRLACVKHQTSPRAELTAVARQRPRRGLVPVLPRRYACESANTLPL